jgi:hypothetical protein
MALNPPLDICFFYSPFLKTLEHGADIFPKSRHVITTKGAIGEKNRREKCVPWAYPSITKSVGFPKSAVIWPIIG